jgi:hypothetical protein
MVTGPGAPSPTGRIVEQRDRDDAAGGRGDEDLVGALEGVEGERGDANLDVEALRQLDGGAPGDAVQHARFGRHQAPAGDGEDVEARAFGDVAVAVEQHRQFGAAVGRLDHAGGQVAPHVVLDRLVEAAHRDALRAGDDHRDALLVLRGRRDPDHRHGEGIDAVAAGKRAAGALRQGPAARRDVDISLREARQRHQPVHHAGDLRLVQRQVEAQFGGAGEEAIEMVVEPEEPPVDHVDHVIRRVGAQESGVEQRDPGLSGRRDLAVDIGRAVCVRVRNLVHFDCPFSAMGAFAS